MYPELADPALLEKRFSPSEMREDLDFLFARVQQLHPDLVSRADPTELEGLRLRLAGELTQPLSRREFYRVIGMATEKFRDGHSGVLFPYPEFEVFTRAGGRVLPLTVHATAHGVFVKENLSDSAQPLAGTRIVSINGQPIATLLASMSRYARGESQLLREQIIARDFSRWLWHSNDYHDRFVVQYQSGDTVKTATVSGLGIDTMDARMNAPDGEAGNPDVRYRSLGDDIGYLDVSYFGGDQGDFKRSIEEAVESAHKENIKALIVDIRDNPGGSTDNVETLLSRMSPVKCSLVSSVKERINDKNRGLVFSRGEPGELIDVEMDTVVKPKADPERFPGRVYLLIGKYTYSSSIVMATAVQDCEVGTLVGEETGGFANQTGQIYFFNLPNSALRAFAPTRLLLRPSGERGQRGVIPDHVVPTSLDDLRDGKDSVLEYTRSLALAGAQLRSANNPHAGNRKP